jgi:ABC-type hemin transport system substrate-binding protein
LAFLQAVRGSLEQAQKPQDLLDVLEQVNDFVMGRETARKEAFAQDYPDLAQFAGFAQRTQAEVKRLSKDINKATAEYNALPSGASYIDDDGIQRTKK